MDVDTDATARVAIVIKSIAEMMSTLLHVEGINTFSAIGVAAGQEVFHYHIHVIPLGKGEKTKFAEWWEQVSKPRSADRVELEELRLRLRI